MTFSEYKSSSCRTIWPSSSSWFSGGGGGGRTDDGDRMFLGTPRTTPTLDGRGARLLSAVVVVVGLPPLNVSDFFKSLLVEGEEVELETTGGGGGGGVNPCRGSTVVLEGRPIFLFPGDVDASSAVLCRIKWTSDEYSPHFKST